MPFADKSPSMQSFLNTIAKQQYGMTIADALEQGVCVKCHQPAEPLCFSVAGKREYQISGLCEHCFEGIFKEPER